MIFILLAYLQGALYLLGDLKLSLLGLPRVQHTEKVCRLPWESILERHFIPKGEILPDSHVPRRWRGRRRAPEIMELLARRAGIDIPVLAPEGSNS